MADILVASDAPWVLDEVTAGVGGPEIEVRSVLAGLDVLPAVVERLPDLVVLDLQIGNMGGMAACLNLRLEEGAGRVGHVPVLMLLDRRADVFLARRSGAEGWLIKPLDPIRLRRAVHALLAGETYHDTTDAPEPVVITAAGAPLSLG
ncbi:MAG: response regulator [Actinomycetota bacterium]|nr:response regulator [Actinomycetota bacterium]